MADLHVTWMKPIKLTKVGKMSLAMNLDDVPNTAGVYMFFRRRSTNSSEVIYVGKGDDLRQRLAWHGNNHALILALLAKPGGTCFLMPGEFKARPNQNAKTAIATIERVLIRTCIEDGHPLINIKGSRIKTQHIVSVLPVGAKVIKAEIGFEPKPAKKPAAEKSATRGKAKPSSTKRSVD
ncbi:MAG: hypothetical protein Q7T73_19925 [Beijerinckiaceae bacterium]|nr:hypothetical protein [Beijerinckiaceae bacterium]